MCHNSSACMPPHIRIVGGVRPQPFLYGKWEDLCISHFENVVTLEMDTKIDFLKKACTLASVEHPTALLQ